MVKRMLRASAAHAAVNAVVYAAYQAWRENLSVELIDQKNRSVRLATTPFPTTGTMPSDYLYVYGIKNNGKAAVIEYMDYMSRAAQHNSFDCCQGWFSHCNKCTGSH